MGQARTNRRYRKRMAANNSHLSGPGVPRYGKQKDAASKLRRIALDRAKAAKTGRSYGFGSN